MDSNKLTVEWAPFKVAANVSDAELFTAANALENNFLKQQPGYVRRELLKGERRNWVDLVYWSSPESAQAASKSFMNSTACQQYFALMADTDGSGVAHYSQAQCWPSKN
jgi:hypothetical protein